MEKPLVIFVTIRGIGLVEDLPLGRLLLVISHVVLSSKLRIREDVVRRANLREALGVARV